MIQKYPFSVLVGAFLSLMLLPNARAEVTSSLVHIEEDGKTYTGTLFLPKDAKKPLPLVVVVHEWWGKTEHSLGKAKRIAEELGYAAFAVDLFGDAKTVDHPKAAGELAGPFYQNPTMGVERLKRFIDTAVNGPAPIDEKRITAIGYCFGGTQVLNLARAGLRGSQKLLGVVSFHGGLASTLKIESKLDPHVLVLHGADDKMVSADEVAAFKAEMKAAKAKYEFHAYPGATHAFTNPKATELGKKHQIPIAYHEAADRDSWEKLKSFLKKLI